MRLLRRRVNMSLESPEVSHQRGLKFEPVHPQRATSVSRPWMHVLLLEGGLVAGHNLSAQFPAIAPISVREASTRKHTLARMGVCSVQSSKFWLQSIVCQVKSNKLIALPSTRKRLIVAITLAVKGF
jgi:hypothetical protein